MHLRPLAWIVLLAGLAAAGCRPPEVRVYEAPKDAPLPLGNPGGEPALAAPPAATPPSEEPVPEPWTVPPGWETRPNTSNMRMASYGVKTPDGRSMDVSVIALGESAGTELENVNRWRQQLKLEPVAAGELAALGTPVQIGADAVTLYDLVSTALVLDGKHRARTLAATLPAGQATVFFKATGEADLVAEQKPNFIAFLNSVQTGGGDPHGGRPPAAGGGGGEGRPGGTPAAAGAGAAEPGGVPAGWSAWDPPAHWRRGGPRPMRLASFEIPAAKGSGGDLSISTLASGGGGLLANVNRWRGQVGLGPVDEVTLLRDALTVDIPGTGKATVVDLGGESAGGPSRILGAILPAGEQTWFFKLTGEPALVQAERENFLGFLRSLRR